MADTSPAAQQYPSLDPYSGSNGTNNTGASKIENAKQTAVNTAQQTMDSVKNSQTYQSLANGPVAEKARNEANATSSEFSNLAASRQPTDATAANGQKLTHYHSFFYNLLSWENPRATGISYAVIVLAIFATRYVPLVRLGLRGAWIILGIMAAAEIVGKLVLGEGFATKLRPKRYYTIPRETLESMMEDLVELANFFVIEFQRIVFAENIFATIAAFTTALITYFLVKITPAWGLALLFATLAYFIPLAYLQNKELIDNQINNASELVGQQTAQIRDLAAQHTNKAMEASQGALKTYSSKAQEALGQAKKAAVDKGYVSEETASKVPGEPIKHDDFPSAPSTEPAPAPVQTDGTTDPTKLAEREAEPLGSNLG